MSGDPYRKAIPGERLKVPARAWNRLMKGMTPDLGFGFTPAGTSHDTIVMRIQQSWPTLSHTPLAVGQGIAVPASGTLLPRLVSQSKNIQTPVQNSRYGGAEVQDEQDLSDYAPSDGIVVDVLNTDSASAGVSRCGIIESVSALSEGFYTCTVRVRGIVRCRVLFLGGGTSVIPPPPYPRDTTLQPFWRRYLTVSTYGYSTLLGVGAYKWLGPPNQNPYVAEAAVFLG